MLRYEVLRHAIQDQLARTKNGITCQGIILVYPPNNFELQE